MYKQLILIASLFVTSSFAQGTGNNSEIPVANPNTITIQHRTIIEYTPDEIDLNITLKEYVMTNPENQQTNTITINELEKQLIDKLKAFGYIMSDLQLSNISDLVQNQNNGMYNVQPTLYTSTQKRLLQKTFVLSWKKSPNKLQEFMEAMRFTGVQSIYINSSVSEEKRKELNEELIQKVMKETREQAIQLSEISGKRVGEIVSANIDPVGLGVISGDAVETYPYFNQYNSFFGSSSGKLSSTSISMVASVVFELIEK